MFSVRGTHSPSFLAAKGTRVSHGGDADETIAIHNSVRHYDNHLKLLSFLAAKFPCTALPG